MTAAVVMMDVVRRAFDHATARPRDIAVRAGDRSITWGQLDARVAAVAAHLRAHLDGGDVVILCAPNGDRFVAAFLGIMRAGLVAFCVAADATSADRRQAVRVSGARAVIGDREMLESLAGGDRVLQHLALDAIDALPDGDADPGGFDQRRAGLYLYSSGTTTAPRIAARDVPAVDAVARNVAETIGLTPRHSVIGAIPMTHAYGVENALLAPLYAGSTIHAMEGLCAPAVLALLREEGAVVFPGVPFMFEVLGDLSAAANSPGLALAYSAGSHLPASVMQRFSQRLGAPIGALYGATEVGSVTFRDPRAGEVGNDVGRPMPGVSVRIIDDAGRRQPVGAMGEVAIQGPSMMRGYLDAADDRMSDGFFLTGDLGRLDALGRLSIAGRLHEQIDIAGRKVNPLEIEATMMSFPGVQECAVVPLPVTATLNRLRAIVVPVADNELCVDALREHCRRHLAGYKVPRTIELSPSLPRSRMGKLLRGQLINS